MNPNDALETAIRAAFDGMREVGPGKLLPRVNVVLADDDLSTSEEEIVQAILAGDGNASARKAAHMSLAKWDAQADAAWAGDTERHSPERRILVFDKLGLSTASREAFDEA